MRTKFATLTLGALIIWRIKRYYADARVDDLQWILAPTARLTTLLSGTPFEWEPGEGYLSRERLLLIEKACAGINFMIAAFGMVTCLFSRRIRSWSSGAGILLASLAAGYAAAVAVNATRIAASMWLAAHAFHLPGMAAGQLHRFEGIVFYFSGLVLLHAVVQRFDCPYRPMRLTTPLVWYYALTLAVPLANGAGRHGAAFVEYALFVLALPLILVGAARVVTILTIESLAARYRRVAADAAVHRGALVAARDPNSLAISMAEIWAGLGDRVKTLQWLEECYRGREPFITFIGVDPMLSSFRDDPHLQSLLHRINYPEQQSASPK